MANPQHLDLLKQGADVWKTWRREHPEEHPDISAAGLHEIDLSGFDLSEATRLFGAQLPRAILQGAMFRETHCSGIDFSVVDMQGVDVSEAYLIEPSSQKA